MRKNIKIPQKLIYTQLIIAVSVLFINCTQPHANNDNNIVKDIEQVCRKVDAALNSYTKYSGEIIGTSPSDKGTVTAYFDNGGLLHKFILEFSDVERVVKLYYREGLLIFMKEIEGSVENSKANESRYYMDDRKLVKYISTDNKESWRPSISEALEKETYVNTTAGIASYSHNSRLTSKVSMYEGKSTEDFLYNEADIKEEIIRLANNNDEVLIPLNATLAALEKNDELTYYLFGTITWGEGVNSTLIVFDIATDNIYIQHTLEHDVYIYASNDNYPEFFKDWIK